MNDVDKKFRLLYIQLAKQDCEINWQKNDGRNQRKRSETNMPNLIIIGLVFRIFDYVVESQ